jgi:hypothetical protein
MRIEGPLLYSQESHGGLEPEADNLLQNSKLYFYKIYFHVIPLPKFKPYELHTIYTYSGFRTKICMQFSKLPLVLHALLISKSSIITLKFYC